MSDDHSCSKRVTVNTPFGRSYSYVAGGSHGRNGTPRRAMTPVSPGLDPTPAEAATMANPSKAGPTDTSTMTPDASAIADQIEKAQRDQRTEFEKQMAALQEDQRRMEALQKMVTQQATEAKTLATTVMELVTTMRGTLEQH